MNGSLWTLTPEVRMYTLLLLVWLCASFAGLRRTKILRFAVIIITIISGAWYLFHGRFEPHENNPRLIFMFFTGSSFYLLRERIAIERSVLLLFISAIVISLIQRSAFFVVLNLLLPYILFCAAYDFGGAIRAFNRIGDYSYGIYIYAFPVQQALASIIHGISIALMFGLSAIITVILAVLSWHLLEKRMLRMKGKVTERTEFWLKIALQKIPIKTPT